MNDEFGNVYKIIKNIVSISEITNKWLMWCEGNLPGQSVFAPSVFQMRDAYAHIVKLLGKGFQNGYLNEDSGDFDAVFNDGYSIKQLEEAFTHTSRAFYDCADYILLSVKNEVENTNPKKGTVFLDLRSKLLKNDSYISELRSSKSEDMAGNYENIKKWNLFLQLITSSYVFADLDLELSIQIESIKTKLNNIENHFTPEIIKNHEPKFYENKKALSNLSKYPDDLETYFSDDTIISKNLLENSSEWATNIANIMSNKIKDAQKYNSNLDALQEIMVNTNKIYKRSNFLKTCWCFISAAISWIITNMLSNRSTIVEVMNNEGNVESVTSKTTDIKFIAVFLLGCLIIYIIGIGISKIKIKIKK